MHRVELDSDSIQNLAYDPLTRILEVTFLGGDRYRYQDVPAEVVLQMLEADSTGAWFNQVFKRYEFSYQRLD